MYRFLYVFVCDWFSWYLVCGLLLCASRLASVCSALSCYAWGNVCENILLYTYTTQSTSPKPFGESPGRTTGGLKDAIKSQVSDHGP